MSNNVTKAMAWLADTDEGSKALDAVAQAGEALRKSSPVKLANSELKYIMERLWAQRGIEGWDDKAHFDVQSDVRGEPKLATIKVPNSISAGLKVRGKGFVILAAIPQARF